jgi:hypothetical protein
MKSMTVLADGSALVVTTSGQRNEADTLLSEDLAALVENAGLDRASFGKLAFFGGRVVDELHDAPDLATVVQRLGDRARFHPLHTSGERTRNERANVMKWLRDPG